jgi:putative cardiolipin synthase
MRLLKHSRPSSAFNPDYDARLARRFDLREDSEYSRLRTIHDNTDAMAWRMMLIDQAEHSIDAQYYSWHLDTSGLALIDKLIQAADRGVRVRLLLDDIHTFGLDRQIAALNNHNNIEVRLFNPFTYRSRFKLIRLMELLFKLSRLNHRMHNKLLVVDNLVAILGGRNIGDEYLGMHDSMVFRDLDLLIAGSCIETLSDSFDTFWNHKLSFAVRKLISLRPRTLDFKHLRKQIDTRLKNRANEVALIDYHISNLLQLNSKLGLLPVTAKVDVLYDPPEFDGNKGKRIVEILNQCLLESHEEIIIVSAYFIPDDRLLETMRQLIHDGTRIKVFTNSLSSIDVTAAFSGYQRYRMLLLSMGVELYEKRVVNGSNKRSKKSYALHSKCIVYDNCRVYVGTLNLDPRSAHLNTEIGLLIDNAELASELTKHMQQQQSYGEYWKLTQNKNHHIFWHGSSTSLSHQPSRGLRQNISNWLFSLLPIKRHL